MKKWRVKLPGNKYFEMESDTPHEDLAAWGHDRYALEEIFQTPPAWKEPPSSEKNDTMLLTVPQMAELLQIGINRGYELCHRRDFPVIRIGRAVRVNKELLQVWLNEHEGDVLL